MMGFAVVAVRVVAVVVVIVRVRNVGTIRIGEDTSVGREGRRMSFEFGRFIDTF
jgi:hypothetical protein